MVQQLLLFQSEWSVPPWEDQLGWDGVVQLEKERDLCEEIRDEDTSKGLLSSVVFSVKQHW